MGLKYRDKQTGEFVEIQLPYLKGDKGDKGDKGETSLITPKQFGCIGDGVSDDSVGLTQAIQYATDNGKVLLLQQTYAHFGVTLTCGVNSMYVTESCSGCILIGNTFGNGTTEKLVMEDETSHLILDRYHNKQ